MFKYFPLFALVLFFSCKKPDKYSSTPRIEFDTLVYYAFENEDEEKMKQAELTFSVYDGEGDIGSFADQTDNNFFSTLYVMENGELVKGEDVGLVDYNYKLPFIEEDDRNINFEADITVEFLYNSLSMKYDTILYEFYLIDQMEHESNKVKSDTVVLQVN